jgi:hypothetical protein
LAQALPPFAELQGANASHRGILACAGAIVLFSDMPPIQPFLGKLLAVRFELASLFFWFRADRLSAPNPAA